MTLLEDPIVGATSSADLVDAADGHPVVAGIRGFANDVLRPAALETDRDGVSAQTIHCFSSRRRRPAAQDDARRHQRRSRAPYGVQVIGGSNPRGPTTMST